MEKHGWLVTLGIFIVVGWLASRYLYKPLDATVGRVLP